MSPAALKSMTGFGQARLERDGWSLRVHIRSVNHRYLDLRLKLPDGFEPFEPQIRQAVRERIRRGHVEVMLHYEPATGAVQVNRELAAAYLRAAEDLRQQFGLATQPDLAAILRLPGVISTAGAFTEEEQEELGRQVLACLAEGLARLDEMRQNEGRALVEELQAHLRRIAAEVGRIEGMAGRIAPAYAKRLEARIAELVGGAALDPARVTQEAAMLAERCDIGEELVRLRSHLRQFETLLANPADVGKRLDFLLQEMQREANTMLSKTPGVEEEGLAITGLALEIKAEIEKLREQAQNIE